MNGSALGYYELLQFILGGLVPLRNNEVNGRTIGSAYVGHTSKENSNADDTGGYTVDTDGATFANKGARKH